ncbi:hypothetical protein CKO25_10650 [Thiocapsa imhoffii]|uniref:Uncharacterized protein n=1 Tax=Thiocapsa imhoffii TaxID=382777 RepID=A0A9X0WI08_9GAMM|nr:hypothetical protein [Thiocapsa imhoffii]MBK1645102.1 hypothetical protein [Thiocapsa imhoffii]
MKKYTSTKRPAGIAQTRLPQSAHAEIRAIARTVDQLEADPIALQRVMQRAGIVTKKGKLTKAFGG